MLRNDPLLHFLVIGGLLFAGLSWLDRGQPPERIVIAADRVAELTRAAELLQGRPPTEAELAALVEELVRDEVYYRRALELGLDVDDDEVRRRLIEKMQYLTENLADPEPPEAELLTYFEQNAERFRIPELVTFDQVFFSPRTRGESAASDAEAALDALRAGAETDGQGDSTPLDSRFEAADAARIRTLFDDALTDAVFAAPLGAWEGPYESGFGWHLVRVVERSAARDPGFAEIEAAVRADYASERLRQANRAAFDEMQSHFDIAVQWEAGSPPESWP